MITMNKHSQRFLNSFLDEFSQTNSLKSITEKTDQLFSAVLEDASMNQLAKMGNLKAPDSVKWGDEYLGDVVQKFSADSWADGINFSDKNLGQVVKHKKTGQQGVVIRSDEEVYRTSDDKAKFKSGRPIPRTPDTPDNVTGWERGHADPAGAAKNIVTSDKIEGYGPFGDVRVALFKKGGGLNVRGKLRLWFAEDYEAVGTEVDVPKLVATAKRVDDDDIGHRRAASWKYKNRKSMPAIRYKRGEDGSWELANPEDFDEETRADLIAKMDQLPDEISAEEIERWRQREEAGKSAKAASLYLDPSRYDSVDDYLNPAPDPLARRRRRG